MRTRRHTEPTFGSRSARPWGRFARDLGPRRPHLRRGLRHLRHSGSRPGSLIAATTTPIPRVLGLPLERRRRPRSPTPASGRGSRGSAPAPRPARQRGLAGSAAGHGRAAEHVVQLVLSAGPAPVTVPDVVARAALRARRWSTRPGSGWDGSTPCAAAGPSPAW